MINFLSLAYNVGDTNATSSAYPKDPVNIGRHGNLSLDHATL